MKYFILSLAATVLLLPACWKSIWLEEPVNDTDSETEIETESETESETMPDFPKDCSDTDWEIPNDHYLTNISDGAVWNISTTIGRAKKVCDLKKTNHHILVPRFHSAAYTRDNRLLVSQYEIGYLWEIVLPSCELKYIGNYEDTNTVFPGLCADQGNDLYGVSVLSGFVGHIDSHTSSFFDVLNIDFHKMGKFGGVGAAWIDQTQEIYIIASSGSQYDVPSPTYLYRIDEKEKNIIRVAMLDRNLKSVGTEYHPHDGNLYVCSETEVEGLSSPPLYRVNIKTGETTLVGETCLSGSICENLAARLDDY